MFPWLSPLLPPLLTSGSRFPLSQISQGKMHNLLGTTAGSTSASFGRLGLLVRRHDRPLASALYPVFVHQLADLLHTSFSGSLAVDALCFASTSGLPACTEDFHLQVMHAWRTAPQGRVPGMRFCRFCQCYTNISSIARAKVYPCAVNSSDSSQPA